MNTIIANGVLSAVAVSFILLAGCAAPPPRYIRHEVVNVAPAALPPPRQIFFYAAKGQTAAQVDRDRYECHGWAVKQSGFDPSLPQAGGRYPVGQWHDAAPARDTAAGALTGAAIGAIAANPRHAGEGAAIGAVIGAVIGAASDAQRQESIARVNEAQIVGAQRAAADQDARYDNYLRALSACGSARGYEVR